MRIATHPIIGRLMLRIPPNQRMVRSLLKQIGLRHAVESGAFGEVEIAWFIALLRHTDTMRNEIGSTPRLMTLRGFNPDTLLPTTLLADVTAPTLFVWGDQDPMGGPAIARSFVDRLPNATLELMTNAGHAPWMDDPDHVADRIVEFLRR